MKERCILMAEGPVRNILAGRQTQDRRPVKPQPHMVSFGWSWDDGPRKHVGWGQNVNPISLSRFCPYGQPGDRLRVKEAAWMWCERKHKGVSAKTGRETWLYVPMPEAPIFYQAEHPDKPNITISSPRTGNKWGWRLKIGRYLPKWASRLTLEITGVRVERLQDISAADACAEGAAEILSRPLNDPLRVAAYARGEWVADDENDPEVGEWYAGAREAFAALWESCYGPGSWDANPWVWVMEFKRLESEVLK